MAYQSSSTIRAVSGRTENPFESVEERSASYAIEDLRDFQGAYVPVNTDNSTIYPSGGVSGQAYRNGIKSMYSTGTPITNNNNNTTKRTDNTGFETNQFSSDGISSVPSPFAKDDIYDERLGVVDKSRPRFNKTQTSANISSRPPQIPAKVRRSMSHDSVPGSPVGVSGITSGLTGVKLVPVKEKVGSKHADVIDFWDGTGIGKSMWHHSGPYDAAAPSRNLHTPHTKAPMSAFIPPNEPHSAPISTPDSREESSESLSISAPGHQSTFDRHRQGSTGGNNAPKISQRAQHALRQGRNASSPGLSGGLSAQYSTSMPNSGGYFAVTSGGDGGVDERRQKEKEREQKRRAMQAAWGVDTPEPYEEFGGTATSPTLEEPYELPDDPTPLPTSPGWGMRSPQLYLSTSRQSPAFEDGPPSPGEYFPTSPDGSRGGAGVKRNKSFMQKIKSMRENPNVPLGGSRTSSSGQLDDRALQRTSTGTPTDESGSTSTHGGSGSTSTVPLPQKTRRNSFLNLRRPSKQGPDPVLPGSPEASEEFLADADRAEQPTFQSKVIPPRHRSGSNAGLNGGFAALVQTRSRSKTGSREKGLPPPPPQPVMPDFSEASTEPRLRFDGNEKGDAELDGGLRRKSSIVKKLRDRDRKSVV